MSSVSLIDGHIEECESHVCCKDCKYLMFSDCYGECSKAHKGIVAPYDYCNYGERRDEDERC